MLSKIARLAAYAAARFVFVATLAAIVSSPVAAAPKQKAKDLTTREIGQGIIRAVDYDLCLPATAEEYEAIGKNAVLRLSASSVLSTELPLQRVYLSTKGLKVPLRKLMDFPLSKTVEGTDPLKPGDRWEQASFYLVPINLIKAGGDLLADFRGARTGFGVGSLSMKSTSPVFLRLDEYDTPGEPEPKALSEMITREYPADFSRD